MLIPLFKIKCSDGKQSELIRMYFCYYSGQVKPNSGELSGGEFMDMETVKERMATEDNFTPFFKVLFQKYYNEFWVTNGNGDGEGSG
jgi:hypothetical protein